MIMEQVYPFGSPLKKVEQQDKTPKNDSKLIRLNSKPHYCPVCGSAKIGTYLWGEPAMSKKLESEMKEGKIIIAGCCISEDDPLYACLECKTDFYGPLGCCQ